MKFFKWTVKVAIIFLLFIKGVFAATLTVPFNNMLLNPNQSIQANFSFGGAAIIFCYEDSFQNVGLMSWPFQGSQLSAALPVSLVTNNQYQGEFSDQSGVLTITNNVTTTLIVSCDFAF